MLSKAIHWVTRCAASSYVAGPEAKDAIHACHQLSAKGLHSTICPWDSPHDSPEHVALSYKKALDSIKSENFDCYLSIKAPSLKYSLRMIKELAAVARGRNIRIHFDSLAPETASSSMNLLKTALPIYQNLGYTLPSRWKRSIADAEILIELGVPIRIVKGQWSDTDEPNIDSRSNFLDLVDSLAGRAHHVAVATHDASLARESLERLKASGTLCELEQLYGLPLRVDSVARPLEIPVRVYVPYGHPYLSYALSEIRRRPIIFAWLLRDFLVGMKKRPNQVIEANST